MLDFRKVFVMKDLRQITVIGLGLLGSSITLAAGRSLPHVKTVGYTHRASTRRKARRLAVASEISGDIKKSVSGADLVILATPISTFEKIFCEIRESLAKNCIVTDVGSTKVQAHRWAERQLPKVVRYVGSHPIAGSEQRGLEFARDDLFEEADCILTATKSTDRKAVRTLFRFWSMLGCSVKVMTPIEHDRIFARVSHLPHVLAAALINANDSETLKFAGKGFMDTTRIASGPANIWADVLLTNAANSVRGIDRVISELVKIKKIIKNKDSRGIEKLLEAARNKRRALIEYKMRRKELIT